MTLVRLAYTDQQYEVAGKALDFSGPTVEQRWQAGRASAQRAIAEFADMSILTATVGLKVVDPGEPNLAPR